MINLKRTIVALAATVSLAAAQGIPLAHASVGPLSAGPLPINCAHGAHALYFTRTYQGGPATFYWTVGDVYGQYTITHQQGLSYNSGDGGYEASDSVSIPSGDTITSVFVSYPGTFDQLNASCQ